MNEEFNGEKVTVEFRNINLGAEQCRTIHSTPQGIEVIDMNAMLQSSPSPENNGSRIVPNQ